MRCSSNVDKFTTHLVSVRLLTVRNKRLSKNARLTMDSCHRKNNVKFNGSKTTTMTNVKHIHHSPNYYIFIVKERLQCMETSDKFSNVLNVFDFSAFFFWVLLLLLLLNLYRQSEQLFIYFL